MDCGLECKEEEDVVKSFQSTTSLPRKKREATLFPSLNLIQMEYFRRLLGALQETLDYVSSFTTYLLGEETHPGAEQSGHTRELVHRSSCHDSEMETAAPSGDVSPQRYLDTFERPLTTEVTPFNQETHVASEPVVTGAQAMEAIPETSKSSCKCEGQEMAGQMLSESPQFLADVPKPRLTATFGTDQQKNLEGLALIQGLHPWEPEDTTLMEGIQQEGLEEVGLDTGSSPHWENRPLTGRNRQGEQNEGGRTDEEHRELEVTVWTEERIDCPLSVVEKPSESEHEKLKVLAVMAENQHLEEEVKEEEEEEEEESATETEWDQQRRTNEGIQHAMLERAETEGNQEGVLEVDRIHQQEPGKTVMTFEEQEWNQKWVTEKGNSHQSRLKGAKDIEDYQPGELEGPMRNEAQAEDKRQDQMDGILEGTSERLVKEEGLEEEVLQEAETRVVQPWDPEWTEKSLQEDPTKSRASLDMYLFGGEQIVGETVKLIEELEEEPVVEVVTLEDEKTSGHQPWEPEGTERRLHNEPMGSRASLDTCLFGGEQIVGEPENLIAELEEEPVVEVVMLEDEKTSGHPSWESERTERRLHDEPMELHNKLMGSRSSLDTCPFGGEQIVGELENLIAELEEEPVVEVVTLEDEKTSGHHPWESERIERRLHGEPMELHNKPMGSRASLDTCLFGGEQIVGEPENLIAELEEEPVVEVVTLEDEKTSGHQPWESERIERRLHNEPMELREEPMGRRASLVTCLFGEEQIVGEPGRLSEEQEVQKVVLEEAETGGHQPWKTEVTEKNLHKEPIGSRASLDASFFDGEQIVQEPGMMIDVAVNVQKEAEIEGHQLQEPERTKIILQQESIGSKGLLSACISGEEQIKGEPEDQQEIAEGLVLKEAETGGDQPWEPEGPGRSLHEEVTGSRASLNECIRPSTFPDEVLPLDTSAQKERVMLRRKSSIRRAPSLKKPRLPMEMPLLPANPTERVPSPSEAPRQPNLRRTGFGPMHPNMMAELQMRLRRPQ